MVVYTNQGDTTVTMPSISLTPAANVVRNAAPSLKGVPAGDPAPAKIIALREQFAQAFKGKVAPARLGQHLAYAPAATTWAVGDTRTIYDAMNSGATLSITLNKTVTTPDGTVVNLWVDPNEFSASKLTQTTVDTLATRYSSGSNSVYSQVTNLIGKPWGETGYSYMIPASQPINIVFYSGNGAGWGGFFFSGDEYTVASYSKSNEWLAFYVNTDQLYGTPSSGYINYYTSVLAHEFTHMIHSYQRSVLLGKPFETWLNELCAMSMEDIVASNVFTSGYNAIRDQRYKYWIALGSGLNASPEVWGGLGSNSYVVNGTLGAFLNRQYGLAYYKALFASAASDSVAVMDGAIKAVGGTSYVEALRRWGDSIALFPLATAPAGQGYPARSDTVNGVTYALAGFNGPDVKSLRVLPTTVPSSGLLSHGHFPFLRSNLGSTWTETLTVPANTSVTVVVQ